MYRRMRKKKNRRVDLKDDKRAEELSKILEAAREAYYNLSGSGISDQEYDALSDELRKLRPDDVQVTSVGVSPPQLTVWKKVAHGIPMGSLNKANSWTEFQEWMSKTGTSSFFMTYKIDGSSMELVYEAGKLVRCVTRGDGLVGEDVTVNVSRVPSVPKELRSNVSATIRGEIVMIKKTFQERYADRYANPRNTAAAKVREKKDGGKACEDLEFFAYWAKSESGESLRTTMSGTFEWLKEVGFQVPESTVTSGGHPAGLLKREYDRVAGDRDSIPYEIDGMVASVEDLELLEELGDQNMRPRGQIAWKFDAAMGVTKLAGIRWQVGLSGRITPVADVEPVNIGGVVITSISLHNLSLFRELALFHGCKVLVSRRNDCIPYIESRLD